MRTTVEFPDPIFREIRIRAASEGKTIREIVLEGVAMRLSAASETKSPSSRSRFPVIRSKKPASLKLGKEGVYEYIPFP